MAQPVRREAARPRFPELPQRPFIFERRPGPLWTRMPRAEEARACEVTDGIVLLQLDDIKAMLRDPRFVQWNLWALESDPRVDRGFVERRRQQLLSMEGEGHVRLRRLAGPALSERAATGYRARMRGVMSQIAGRVADAGRCEAVGELCRPYPVPVICAVMGVPAEDTEFFISTAEAWQSWILGGAAAVARSSRAHEEMTAYLRTLIERRRSASGGDDMLSLLTQAEEQGDRLTHEEVVRMIAGFIVGGTDTTRQALANALYLFSEHPDQWERLAADPSLAPGAVDETLRVLPLAMVLTRVAHEDVEVNGLPIPARTKVYASIVSANHDSRLHPDPSRFDIGRRGEPLPMSFGYGRHACIGLHLARAELQEGLVLLAQTLAKLGPAGAPEWQPIEDAFQGPRRLPLRFRRR